MTDYKRINNVMGWLVFLIATIVYVLTLEPTASFWDSGEFIACSYKLLVPHPPGAPLYLLIGRICSMFAGDVTQVAWWVNLLSALSSSFTVLFLFWTITLMARKLLVPAVEADPGLKVEPTPWQTILIMGAGAVGALSFTFSDSFWFSAVEAEVYAMSAFFTAFVVWAMLRWEQKSDSVESDKWLILIAYMMGLSIGVHLLNLLAIPALAFIFYFRRYKKPTAKGGLMVLVVSGLILGIILSGIIPGLPSLAGSFEIFFVNNLSLPFGSGLIFFTALFVGLLVWAILYSIRRNLRMLNTALLCFTFILIGYSSYMIIPIRSAYNPTIDENNPENIISFVSYLKREQYGDRPLLYGPQFTAQVIAQERGAPRYERGERRYVIVDHKIEPEYDPRHKTLLPRLYSSSPYHISHYKKWVNIEENRMPTMGQNLSFLWNYQLGHMYWRYFLWNFAGRESDIQQSGVLWPWSSNQNLPERIEQSKARNNFYMIPLLIGIAGLVFQVRRHGRDAFIVGLLFFFTGLAIALYLNQPPIEPRERDYTFAGSTYAFSIWIGLGVLGIAELLRRAMQPSVGTAALATAIGLSSPIILGVVGWDDHDRSGRYHSVDSAKNLLSSCAPNAVLFTNGDNDTFPLWYAQEVEGFRTDVRVAVLSYMNTDWYIDQMKRQSYLSDPLPISLEPQHYRQGTNDYLPFVERAQVKAGMDLAQYIDLVKQNHPALQLPEQGGKTYLSFPTRNFFLNVNRQQVQELGVVPAGRQENIVDRMDWTISKGGLEKKHLAILDLLVTNNWRRPIYFSTTVDNADFMGLDRYFQLEGLAFRILPVPNPDPNPASIGFLEKDIMYENMMTKFQWRNLDDPSIFYDENYHRFTANARDKFASLALDLMASGDSTRAREVIDHAFTVIPDASIPYDYYTPQFIEPMAALGNRERAVEILEVMARRSDRALNYYFSSGSLFDTEIRTNLFVMQQLAGIAREIGLTERATEIEQNFMRYYQRLTGGQ
jgi:hypothetical protein